MGLFGGGGGGGGGKGGGQRVCSLFLRQCDASDNFQEQRFKALLLPYSSRTVISAMDMLIDW